MSMEGKMKEFIDYYKLLDISSKASIIEIKKKL